MLIKDVMNTELFTLRENDKISEASDIMKLKQIRHIPIVDKSFKLVGLVTYRELLRAVIINREKGSTGSIRIQDIMKNDVKAVEPEAPLKGAIDLMIVNKFGCLPVVDRERKLLGIVSEIDLLKTLYDMTPMPENFYATKGK